MDNSLFTYIFLIILNKKDPEGSNFDIGATNGIGLEKYCIEFAELSIHETELIVQLFIFMSYE